MLEPVGSCPVESVTQGAICAGPTHAEQINRVLFAIADAVNTTEDLDELYRTLHHILGDIIDTTNFYIAIVDRKQQTLHFPYHVDTYDNIYPSIKDFPTGSSLTGLLLEERKPMLLRTEALRKRAAQNGIRGSFPLIWMASPLLIRDEAIGVVAVQSYTDAEIYNEADLQVLTAVSQQIAVAIDRKRYLDKLQKSEETFRNIVQASPMGIHMYQLQNDDSLVFIGTNPAADKQLGMDNTSFIGMTLEEAFPPLVDTEIPYRYRRAARHGESWQTEQIDFQHGEISGAFEVFVFQMSAGKAAVLFNDITGRKRAEEEKTKLQMQLTQAQKMESVGRLAGGVAHDFNNMLGVILGHTEMALNRLDPGQPLFVSLQEINKAARRSADLTRQLLAFARKQTIAPKIIDLNETMDGMLTMLRRLIGEDIDLAWLPGKNLGTVKMDPSQLDQILANLCVNARDAIADTGKVTIETGTVVFDEAYCITHAGFVPGEYVMLAVSDDGCGMDSGIKAHLFEPFFTTKATGKGTGLGLATIYGIVKQNSGFINVYSEPGQGTSFKIYLPRHRVKAAQAAKGDAAGSMARGNESILLVEDEPMILDLTTTMLELQGYKVLPAATPGEAIRLAREHAGEIHLLMTDVVMPEMNGRDLARNLLSLYPNLKRLFMSGYTANVIAHRGVLDEGVHFIQKPFSMNDLAAKIKEAMGGDFC
ncbi:MAG: response regulator [Proteobacteria bacterium]|nr:response regulator [Pseudomonadota bacterium]